MRDNLHKNKHRCSLKQMTNKQCRVLRKFEVTQRLGFGSYCRRASHSALVWNCRTEEKMTKRMSIRLRMLAGQVVRTRTYADETGTVRQRSDREYKHSVPNACWRRQTRKNKGVRFSEAPKARAESLRAESAASRAKPREEEGIFNLLPSSHPSL